MRYSNLFSFSLLAATIMPPICALAGLNFINLLFLVSSTHVFAMTYLFFDPNVRIFLKKNALKVIVIPAAIFLLTVATLYNLNAPWVPVLSLLSLLWATWHYGAQNIGVCSFVSRGSRGCPMSGREKNILKATVFLSMAGILRIFSPDFGIGQQYAKIDPQLIVFLDQLYTVARFVALPVMLYAIFHLWKNASGIFYEAVFLLCCVNMLAMFYAPTMLFGFTIMATAHGLQYICFLGAKKSSWLQILLLPVFIACGYFLWSELPAISFTPDALNVGNSIIGGLTLAHFWIDQYLWKMSDKNAREWITSRYDFMLQTPPKNTQESMVLKESLAA